MESCLRKLLGFCLLAAVPVLACLPGVAHAQSQNCGCPCAPSWLFGRGCTNCYDPCQNPMAQGPMAQNAMPGEGMPASPAQNYSDNGANQAFNLGEGAPAQSGSTFAVLDNPGGYIDSAIVGNVFRFRFDAAYDNPMPDRVEFFYGQCGCFGGNAPGPPLAETRVDYQEFIPYLEWAFNNRFSVFGEAPVRLINPEVNQNAGGFSDLNVGFKYALIACPNEYLTAQLRIYTPTGQADLGLGTGHVSIEPSLLYFRRIDQCWTLQAELRDWIPISDSVTPTGQPFAGNVLRYGVGLGYDLWSCCDGCTSKRLTPVGEIVGWTILDGFGFNGNIPPAGALIDQSGVTIVNAKLGVRYTVNQHSFYAGAGTALTNQFWYADIIRLEYRQAF
jgi:hypothetical protein